MKIIWQYARKLKISILFVDSESVPLTRRGDMAWIDKLSLMGFKGSSLVKLNRVRKFKNVHSVSDTTACDGFSILPDALTDRPGTSTREWSIEQPTREDFSLWRHAMSLAYDCDGKLRNKLGDFIAFPHTHHEWTMSSDSTALCEQKSPTEFRIYKRLPLLRYNFKTSPTVK